MNPFGILTSHVRRFLSKRADTSPPGSPASGRTALGTRVVHLLPGFQSCGTVECHLRAVLAHGPLPFDALIDEVAEQLLHIDVTCGGWAADIGMVGPGIYKPQAASIIRALDGLMLRIDPQVAEFSGT